MAKDFAEFDFSSDVGIEAWGASVEETIENATLGLFSLMVRGTVPAVIKRELTVVSQSHEDLLIDWLSEVIAAASTYGEVYGAVEIRRTGRFAVSGSISGSPFGPGRHELRFEVKAATYHKLQFEAVEGGYHARVIFDL